MKFVIKIADENDVNIIQEIIQEVEESAKGKGVAIAIRSCEYLEEKISQRKAIVAYFQGEWAGFCYLETWDNDEFVSHSGLIVRRKFRKEGLAKLIKEKIFIYSRERYPSAKIFGLTTSHAVMKINSYLGYAPVIYSELPKDKSFWKGCESCINHPILKSKEGKNCLCTGMLYVPINNL